MPAMMRGKKEEPVPVVQEEKILDVSASMQGALRFDDPVNLRINGKFDGTLDTKGKLMIGAGANIKANITGEAILIEGNVTGTIKASEMLKLARTAKLVGDVETPRLAVEDGATLIGNVRMTVPEKDGSSVSAETMSAFEVAKYLEVDGKKVGDWASSGVLPARMDNGVWFFEKSKIDEWIAQGKIKS